MHFCTRKYFLQFFQKERLDNIFLYQSQNRDESFSYPAASKNEGLRGRSRCGRLSTAPKSAVGGRALFRKKRPSRLKRFSRENTGPAFREAAQQPTGAREAGAKHLSPEGVPELSTVSAARRAVERPRLPMKGRSPKPEHQPLRRGQSRQPKRRDAGGSQKPTPGRRTKKTGRSGKRSIPRMENQWREAARRFGLA